MNRNDDHEWRVAFFEGAVADPDVRTIAWNLAQAMRNSDDPELTLSDQACSRNYLRKCVMTSAIRELSMMQRAELGGLWARGILGAARFRANGGRRPKRASSSPRQDES